MNWIGELKGVYDHASNDASAVFKVAESNSHCSPIWSSPPGIDSRHSVPQDVRSADDAEVSLTGIRAVVVPSAVDGPSEPLR
jgi:hypothetical protein